MYPCLLSFILLIIFVIHCICQENAISNFTALCCYSTLLYSTLLYSTLLYSTLLYSTLLYSTLLYSTLLYSTLLYSTLLYSTLNSTLNSTAGMNLYPRRCSRKITVLFQNECLSFYKYKGPDSERRIEIKAQRTHLMPVSF